MENVEDSIWSSHPEEFVYQPLDTTSNQRYFRLIELLPGIGSDSSNLIKCNLKPFDLDSPPAYEALSYSWGRTTDKTSISCNNASLDVTNNLESALRHLRHDEDIRVIWIDQICIDQMSPTDKFQQVGMMRDIYKYAERTLVWLGDASQDSGSAITVCESFVRSLGTEDGQKLTGAFTETSVWAHNPQSKKLEGAGLPTKEQQTAIVRLFKRSWFNRIWVVQEVGVAAEVLVVCGDQKIDFDILLIAFSLLIAYTRQIKLGRPEFLYGMLVLSLVRQWRQTDSAQLELHTLLRHTRKFGSTDPRDKVFALLGITSTDIEALTIQPDYRLSTAAVYKQVTFSILESTRSLRVLENQRGKTDMREIIPSWVPDWSDSSMLGVPLARDGYSELSSFGTERLRAVIKKIVEPSGLNVEEKEEILTDDSNTGMASMDQARSKDVALRKFAASRGSSSPVPTLGKDGAITLSGHIVEKIDHVGRVSIAPDLDADTMTAVIENGDSFSEDVGFFSRLFSGLCDYIRVLLEWDAMALKDKKSPYPTGETQITAYWQTLCAGYFPEGFEKGESDFLVWRKALQGPRLIKRLNYFEWKTPGIMTLLTTLFGSLTSGRQTRVFATMAEPTLKRRLARTVRGYLALVPAESQPGDMVTILKGGQLPFILRSRGGTWELIGASYVHGIMYGEAFDEERCGNVKLI